jgi:hypothetical protein
MILEDRRPAKGVPGGEVGAEVVDEEKLRQSRKSMERGGKHRTYHQ